MVSHPLTGAFADLAEAGDLDAFNEWIGDLEDWIEKVGLATAEARDAAAAVKDPEYAAVVFGMMRKEVAMKIKRRDQDELVLPTGRYTPSADPWEYAYLLTGEKKIGKTSFSIEGCEELVLQCDKPQIAYELREVVVDSWATSKKAIAALEKLAGGSDPFPYQRVVVDGAGEWYNMCQIGTCRKFQVSHPSEEGYARAWHYLRDDFTDSVNRLLRLQRKVGCGLVFIAHSERKTKKTKGGDIEQIVPNLPPRCEEILNGKCDGWFMMDYVGEHRVMTIQGDESVGAGHRIDGRFLTPGGERVREIPMGSSAKEALANFIRAFNNEQPSATFKEMRDRPEKGGARRIVVRRK